MIICALKSRGSNEVHVGIVVHILIVPAGTGEQDKKQDTVNGNRSNDTLAKADLLEKSRKIN